MCVCACARDCDKNDHTAAGKFSDFSETRAPQCSRPRGCDPRKRNSKTACRRARKARSATPQRCSNTAAHSQRRSEMSLFFGMLGLFFLLQRCAGALCRAAQWAARYRRIATVRRMGTGGRGTAPRILWRSSLATWPEERWDLMLPGGKGLAPLPWLTTATGRPQACYAWRRRETLNHSAPCRGMRELQPLGGWWVRVGAPPACGGRPRAF